MVNATELRIGNIVLSRETDPPHFHTIGCNDMGEFYSAVQDSLDPIPLTPEIMEKCGFEKKDVTYQDIGYIGNDGDGRYQTFHKKVFKYGQMSIIQESYRSVFEFRELSTWPCREVKYIHQLQNLFYALCGEELNVLL